jgi:hypothetical protein
MEDGKILLINQSEKIIQEGLIVFYKIVFKDEREYFIK